MKSKFTYAIVIFVVSLLTLVILSLNFQERIRRLLSSYKNVERSNQFIIELNKLEHYIKEAESGQRGFMLTQDSSFLKSYTTFSKLVNPSAKKIQDLSGDSIQLKNKIAKLRNFISKRMEVMHFALQAYQNKDSNFHSYFYRGKLLMDTCQQILREIENQEQLEFEKLNSRKNFYVLKAPENFRNIFLVSLFLLLLSFFLIMREIVRRSSYQRELQAKVIELNQTYEELQQVTFITSHDFQEPLRKIRIFTTRLTGKHREKQDEEGVLLIDRIQVAAGRIQELIQEMVQYMSLSRTNERLLKVSFSVLIQQALNDMSEHSVLKKAEIDIKVSATLLGYPNQIRLLFKVLIDNAIKFSHPDRVLKLSFKDEVTNSAKNGEGNQHPWYRITIQDNGIGFEQEFSRKIFHLFKTLGNTDSNVEGKGVGLALAEKIMANHQGFITAEGKAGEGAVFHLYFPVTE